MAKKKERDKDGIRSKDVNSWDEFSELFNNEYSAKKEASNGKLYLGDYVWRGQQRRDWRLVSSFDREFMREKDKTYVYSPDRFTILKRHLNSFVYAVRGKLKEFELTVREIKAANKNKLQNKNHIWALAQHYDLMTPLLDWCYSPYVAAYFAFRKKKGKNKLNKHRVVWGLNYKQVCDNYTKAKNFKTGIDYFDPMSSEHPRLINQRGLFTITKDNEAFTEGSIDDIDIEGIIRRNECAGCNGPWLIRIRLTDTEKNREEFLRRLSAMNINGMSLFPEIEGAAEFCNTGLKFDEYARFHGQRWCYKNKGK